MQRRRYPPWSILIVVLVVFIQVFSFEFLSYDDNINIYNYDAVSRLSLDNFLYCPTLGG